MINKCENCPCADLPFACPAKYRPHPHFCTLADNPAYRARIREVCLTDKVSSHIDNIMNGVSILDYKPDYVNTTLILKYIDEDALFLINNLLSFNIKTFNLMAICFLDVKHLDGDTLKLLQSLSLTVLFGVDAANHINGMAEFCISYKLTKNDPFNEDIVNLGIETELSTKYNYSYENFISKFNKLLNDILLQEKFIFKPTLKEKSFSFVKSMVNYAASGFKNAETDLYQKRIATCEACPLLNPNRTCQACGCLVDLKARIFHEPCPKGKWETLQTTQQTGCGCNKQKSV